MGKPGTPQDDDVRSREWLRPYCMDTGEQQADRYDLSKQVDKIKLNAKKNNETRYYLLSTKR